jgi:hypothetical protein
MAPALTRPSPLPYQLAHQFVLIRRIWPKRRFWGALAARNNASSRHVARGSWLFGADDPREHHLHDQGVHPPARSRHTAGRSRSRRSLAAADPPDEDASSATLHPGLINPLSCQPDWPHRDTQGPRPIRTARTPAHWADVPRRGQHQRWQCRDCQRRMTGKTCTIASQVTYHRCPHTWATPHTPQMAGLDVRGLWPTSRR